mgnify:CR=1 FL=1
MNRLTRAARDSLPDPASRGGRKSTVATTTEVWHFLRLLYVKLGVQHCVHDGAPVRPQSVESIAAQLMRDAFSIVIRLGSPELGRLSVLLFWIFGFPIFLIFQIFLHATQDKNTNI